MCAYGRGGPEWWRGALKFLYIGPLDSQSMPSCPFALAKSVGASALLLATRPSAGRCYHLPVITQQCNQLLLQTAPSFPYSTPVLCTTENVTKYKYIKLVFRDQCWLRTMSLVYLVQICSSIRKHLISYMSSTQQLCCYCWKACLVK